MVNVFKLAINKYTFVLFTLCYFTCLWPVWLFIKADILEELSELSANRLSLYVQHLDGELKKFQFLPQLLATDTKIPLLFREIASKNGQKIINEYFETVNHTIGGDVTYLVDQAGTAIASSNWRTEKSFVGKNYSYRPYFLQAMSGTPGSFFAIGTVSGKRGYYFSYPLTISGKIVAAIVIKIDFSKIEANWVSQEEDVIVTDFDDIVFFATRPNWRYRSLVPVAQETLEKINETRRYSRKIIKPFPLHVSRQYDETTQLWRVDSINDKADGRDKTQPAPGFSYLVKRETMLEAGWKIHLLTPLTPVNDGFFSTILTAIIIYIIFALISLFVQQRNKRKRELLLYEQQTRRALHYANEQLELKVQKRTHELELEVIERRHTERALRQTQDDLIHSATLASLGQMSSSVSHELNQPLAAIRSYTDNALLLIKQSRSEEVSENLHYISDLTERMAKISAQLKQYVRKDQVNLQKVHLAHAIEASQRILKPKLDKIKTGISLTIANNNVEVLADQVLLEQVLVNLLSNAINAMSEQSNRQMEINVATAEHTLKLEIRDYGPGIPEEIIEKIFTPFFTTRATGLGLGLAISHRIVKSMGGDLTVKNHGRRGAIFILKLNLH